MHNEKDPHILYTAVIKDSKFTNIKSMKESLPAILSI